MRGSELPRSGAAFTRRRLSHQRLLGLDCGERQQSPHSANLGRPAAESFPPRMFFGKVPPASALAAGEYQLALKAIMSAASTQDIGYYYFTVLKH